MRTIARFKQEKTPGSEERRQAPMFFAGAVMPMLPAREFRDPRARDACTFRSLVGYIFSVRSVRSGCCTASLHALFLACLIIL